MSVIRESIIDMSLEELAECLEEKGIEYEHLQTIEEMQALCQLHCGDITADKSSMVEESYKNQEVMKGILENDWKMRQELADIYDKLAEFLNDRGDTLYSRHDNGLDCIKSVMNEMHVGFAETIVEYRKELLNDECPIVVAGETSAGKSSLLNLILGTDVLAHSLLGTTSTICRLHNSEMKRVEITYTNGDVLVEEDKNYTDEEWRDKLNPNVTSRDEQTAPQCQRVDVYWPIPLLQEHVMIVDTPGIGEHDQLTDVLLSYLPKAVALIYVINSANSGGVQDDYLLRILNEQKDWASAGRSTSIDYDSTLFVCNKWDKVEKEEEEVWKYIQDKITAQLDGFPKERILKMSATEADRYMKSGLGRTTKFEQLLTAIEKMVAQSMKGKIRKYFKWIEQFLTSLNKKIVARINHAKTTSEDKAKLKEEVLKRIGKLNGDSEQVKKGLIQTAKTECLNIAEKLFKHVNTETVKDEILTWNTDDIPDIQADDLEVTKFRAEQIIVSRIRNILKRWEKETRNVEVMSETLRKLFIGECNLLGKECENINLLVEGETDEWSDDLVIVRQPIDKNQTVFTKSEKVVLAVMSPLWVPLVTAASILFLPVGVGMFINESIKERKQRADFMENKPKYMKEWAKKATDIAFTKDNIKKFVMEVYFDAFERRITEMCSEFIPNQIAADQKMINDIAADMRTSSVILKEFQPLRTKLGVIIGKLRMFELDHLKLEKIPAIILDQNEPIGHGNFSDVYKSKWTNTEGQEMDAAFKVIRQKLTGSTLLGQLDEVDCLRSLQHHNIVKLYGTCYSSRENSEDRRLTIVLELCDGCLENIVFNNEQLQCRKYRTTVERSEAFAYYLNMAAGVCEGLAEMHKHKYLHRDLKLSNVLVKNNMAKLCDLGFAKAESLMTSTFAGTMTHMSPELLRGERYTLSSDVYSVSILLWELWYGRHVYSEDEYASCRPLEIIDAIKIGIGRRPKLTYMYGPPEDLKNLIVQCWDSVPTKRPLASEVGDRLRQMEGGSDEHVSVKAS